VVAWCCEAGRGELGSPTWGAVVRELGCTGRPEGEAGAEEGEVWGGGPGWWEAEGAAGVGDGRWR
jgi:hypothetical protein